MKKRKYFTGTLSALLCRGVVESAADAFRGQYGNALADDIAIPLVEAWSGISADQISKDAVAKLPDNYLTLLWVSLVAAVCKRPIAIGYCREKPLSIDLLHVYPKDGLGAMIQKLAGEVEENISLQSPVEKVVVEKGNVKEVWVCGKPVETETVFSSMPVNYLGKSVVGTNALSYLERFRYRPMIFVNLSFDKENILPNVVLWTPDKELPFFRLSEATQAVPGLSPQGKTTITADIGVSCEDRFWNMSDDEVTKICLDKLEGMMPGVRQHFIKSRLFRTKNAYSIFNREYENERQKFAQTTGVGGLYSIGRNGEFEHLLMEDIYWRTMKKVGEFLWQNSNR